MLVLALTVDQAGGGQVAEIARTFGVDWPHLTAQILSFSPLCCQSGGPKLSTSTSVRSMTLAPCYRGATFMRVSNCLR